MQKRKETFFITFCLKHKHNPQEVKTIIFGKTSMHCRTSFESFPQTPISLSNGTKKKEQNEESLCLERNKP